MKQSLFLAAVGSAMVVGLVSTSASAGTPRAKTVPVTCPKQEATASKRVDHTDLTQNGLVFDQAAPGGARPEDQSEMEPQTAVDPTTVTLFPSASSTATPTTTGKKDDHAQDDCP
jgi:hypothetical protein